MKTTFLITVALLIASASAVVDPKLFWKFETNVSDSSATSAYPGITDTQLTYVSGIRGYALFANGTQFVHSMTNVLSSGNPAFSISFWLFLDVSKLSSVEPQCVIQLSQTLSEEFYILLDNTEAAVGLVDSYNDSSSFTVPSSVYSVSHWQHWVITNTASHEMSLYIDGTSFGTQASMFSFSNTIFSVGCADDMMGFYGMIDEVMLFDRALNSTEIQALEKTTCTQATSTGVSNPVTLDLANTHFTTLNTMQITVIAPIVDGRSDVSFTIGSCSLAATKQTSGCTSVYTILAGWTDLTLCGFAKTSETSTTEKYSGSITSTYTEPAVTIKDIAITRTIATDLPLSVTFSTQTSVSTSNVKLTAPALLSAALSSVTVSHSSLNSSYVSLELTVGVQNPFNLTALFAAIPQNYGTIILGPTLIPSKTISQSNLLIQTWNVMILPQNGVCSFNTLPVNVNFTVYCQTGTSGCAFTKPEPAALSFSVTTGDFCGVVVDDVSVTSTVSVYSSNSFTEQTTAFFMSKFAYFAASLASPKVSITSASIVSVAVSGSAVISSPTTITETVLSDLSVPTNPKFWFELTPTIFQAQENSFSNLVVETVFRVTYLGNTKKREMQQQEQYRDIKVTTTASITGTDEITSAASHNSPWMFF